MPNVTIDTAAILKELKGLVDAEEFKAKVDRLKALNVNPFDLGEDNTPEGWANSIEAVEILRDITLDAIRVAEKVVYEAGETAKGKDKLDAVVGFLDGVIRVPWYLEMFDGPAIKLVVTLVVSGLNELFGKDWINHIPVPA